jgi:hypothetical protein
MLAHKYVQVSTLSNRTCIKPSPIPCINGTTVSPTTGRGLQFCSCNLIWLFAHNMGCMVTGGDCHIEREREREREREMFKRRFHMSVEANHSLVRLKWNLTFNFSYITDWYKINTILIALWNRNLLIMLPSLIWKRQKCTENILGSRIFLASK